MSKNELMIGFEFEMSSELFLQFKDLAERQKKTMNQVFLEALELGRKQLLDNEPEPVYNEPMSPREKLGLES